MADEAQAVAEKQKPADEMAIKVRNVTKRFGSTVAVNNVSFDVRKGEVVGFLGPNGSGKTTTMRLITSYYTPDSGTITVDGVDNQVQDVVTRQKIGYLPENNPLYGDMLVHEYLEFIADLRGVPSQDKRANMDQAVEEASIAEVYYRPVSQCSKGYKQRVGLAQALLHRPDILIMDEPTEGLDPNQRVPIREVIRSSGKDRTVLLSTHVLQEVQPTCDRIMIISKGRIVAQGTVEDLQAQAKEDAYIDLEVEGDGVGATLRKLRNVDSVREMEPVDGRQRFVVSVAGDEDLRPEIFRIAKRRNWTLWDLHLESARLEDMFHSLTMQGEGEGQ